MAGSSSITTTRAADIVTPLPGESCSHSPRISSLLHFILERIIGKEDAAQPQIGIVKIRVQDLAVKPFGDRFGAHVRLAGQHLMNLPPANAFVDSGILGQEL